MSVVLVTGGAGFLGSHLCERLLARGDEVICVDNFFTGRKANIAHLLSNPRFELIRHDIVHPLFSRGRPDLQPGLSRLAAALPVQPHQDDQDFDGRNGQHAGAGQTLPRADLAGIDVGSLRRSRSPSADGRLLGTRQPDRPAKLLRRREARRRIAVHELPPRSTSSKSASPASSTPTARGWTRDDGAWSRISSRRPCAASR